MQIFCFDLMIAELAARRGIGTGFLVHDSHLFDGVDERQVAKALQLGADPAASVGFQYIVTMNSTALPGDGFREGFDVRDHFIELRWEGRRVGKEGVWTCRSRVAPDL